MWGIIICSITSICLFAKILYDGYYCNNCSTFPSVQKPLQIYHNVNYFQSSQSRSSAIRAIVLDCCIDIQVVYDCWNSLDPYPLWSRVSKTNNWLWEAFVTLVCQIKHAVAAKPHVMPEAQFEDHCMFCSIGYAKWSTQWQQSIMWCTKLKALKLVGGPCRA